MIDIGKSNSFIWLLFDSKEFLYSVGIESFTQEYVRVDSHFDNGNSLVELLQIKRYGGEGASYFFIRLVKKCLGVIVFSLA